MVVQEAEGEEKDLGSVFSPGFTEHSSVVRQEAQVVCLLSCVRTNVGLIRLSLGSAPYTPLHFVGTGFTSRWHFLPHIFCLFGFQRLLGMS